MARIERELKARGAAPPWRAHFVSALALAWPDGRLEAFEGRVDGHLVFPPRGTSGFGYDPIFVPDGHRRSFGEMTAQEKHGLPRDNSLALSHRARAFQKLARALSIDARGAAGKASPRHGASEEARMDEFDRRKKGFDKFFALSEALRFKALSRRNRAVGEWAAEKLGLAGERRRRYGNAATKPRMTRR